MILKSHKEELEIHGPLKSQQATFESGLII